MADIGKLCYKSGSGANAGKLCYKSGSGANAGKLCYKVEAGDWTTITFAWSSQGRDLDICAYWTGAPNMAMGFGHNTSTSEQTSGSYHIFYSGDKQGTNDAEWVKIKMNPWSGGARTFSVHFNFYGYDASSYPETQCTVIASQINGPTLIKRNQPCGTSYHSAATTASPSCTVEFDSSGRLISLT